MLRDGVRSDQEDIGIGDVLAVNLRIEVSHVECVLASDLLKMEIGQWRSAKP